MPKYIDVEKLQLEPDPFDGGMNGVLILGKRCGKTIQMVQTALRCMIDNAPAEAVAPVERGRWEEWWPGDCSKIMTGEEMLYHCSVCSAKYADVEGMRYCPRCGAFMEGSGDDGKV